MIFVYLIMRFSLELLQYSRNTEVDSDSLYDCIRWCGWYPSLCIVTFATNTPQPLPQHCSGVVCKRDICPIMKNTDGANFDLFL